MHMHINIEWLVNEADYVADISGINYSLVLGIMFIRK